MKTRNSKNSETVAIADNPMEGCAPSQPAFDTGDKHVPDSKSRRDWLLLTGRAVVAAALGLGGGLLLRGRSCPDGSCPACPEQGGCQKPDAEAFRDRVRRRDTDGGKRP